MKTIVTAFRALAFFTVVTGLVYPLLLTSLAQTIFPHQASGSLVRIDGRVVGSELLAQEFKSDEYFWPRPSAVAYNPLPSGGTNLSPRSRALQEKWAERVRAGFSGEMVAASASGLDPHISAESAFAQVGRVARARGRSEEDIRALVSQSVEGRQFGFLGESRVNVLQLNVLLGEGEASRE